MTASDVLGCMNDGKWETPRHTDAFPFFIRNQEVCVNLCWQIDSFCQCFFILSGFIS